MSCPAIRARSSCGTTVSSKPWMPGQGSRPSRRAARRLPRSSSRTDGARAPTRGARRPLLLWDASPVERTSGLAGRTSSGCRSGAAGAGSGAMGQEEDRRGPGGRGPSGQEGRPRSSACSSPTTPTSRSGSGDLGTKFTDVQKGAHTRGQDRAGDGVRPGAGRGWCSAAERAGSTESVAAVQAAGGSSGRTRWSGRCRSCSTSLARCRSRSVAGIAAMADSLVAEVLTSLIDED